MAAKLTREEKYMKAAIREAKKAWALGEVPIGCVIVYYPRRQASHFFWPEDLPQSAALPGSL